MMIHLGFYGYFKLTYYNQETTTQLNNAQLQPVTTKKQETIDDAKQIQKESPK